MKKKEKTRIDKFISWLQYLFVPYVKEDELEEDQETFFPYLIYSAVVFLVIFLFGFIVEWVGLLWFVFGAMSILSKYYKPLVLIKTEGNKNFLVDMGKGSEKRVFMKELVKMDRKEKLITTIKGVVFIVVGFFMLWVNKDGEEFTGRKPAVVNDLSLQDSLQFAIKDSLMNVERKVNTNTKGGDAIVTWYFGAKVFSDTTVNYKVLYAYEIGDTISLHEKVGRYYKHEVDGDTGLIHDSRIIFLPLD